MRGGGGAGWGWWGGGGGWAEGWGGVGWGEGWGVGRGGGGGVGWVRGESHPAVQIMDTLFREWEMRVEDWGRKVTQKQAD